MEEQIKVIIIMIFPTIHYYNRWSGLTEKRIADFARSWTSNPEEKHGIIVVIWTSLTNF